MTSGTTFSAISRWWTRCSVACGITATRWPSTVPHYANCRAELMDGPLIDPRDYVRRLLEAYRATPGTSGAVHRADRLLAARLHERGVPGCDTANDTARRRGAAGNDPLTGVLFAGDRRSAATAGRPGILSVPPPQTSTCRLGTIALIPFPERNPPPHPARLQRGRHRRVQIGR